MDNVEHQSHVQKISPTNAMMELARSHVFLFKVVTKDFYAQMVLVQVIELVAKLQKFAL